MVTLTHHGYIGDQNQPSDKRPGETITLTGGSAFLVTIFSLFKPSGCFMFRTFNLKATVHLLINLLLSLKTYDKFEQVEQSRRCMFQHFHLQMSLSYLYLGQ